MKPKATRGRPPGTPGTATGRSRPEIAGRPAKRPKPTGVVWHEEVDDPIARAVDGDVDADEWDELREAAWKEWAKLIARDPITDEKRDARLAEERRDGLVRDPSRDALSNWPPLGARHDGIVGDVLAREWDPPDGYVGGWDARAEIVALAEADLADLARFRRRKAAKPIRPALVVYARLLREAARNPESRLRPSDG